MPRPRRSSPTAAEEQQQPRKNPRRGARRGGTTKTDSDDESPDDFDISEQKIQARKNPRRGARGGAKRGDYEEESPSDTSEQEQKCWMNSRHKKTKVNYAEESPDDPDDEDDDDIEEPSYEAMDSEEGDNLEESDFEEEVVASRRSTRAHKQEANTVLTEQRVSSRNNKAKKTMQEDSGDDIEEVNCDDNNDNNDDEAVPMKAKSKSPARKCKKDRLSLDSLGLSSAYTQEDKDESFEESEEEGHAKKQKENKPPKEFEPFRISKILAVRTETGSTWKEVCKRMNTTEVDIGSRWIQEEPIDIDATEERFLVKWSDMSYMHCSWETKKDLLEFVQGAKQALGTFERRCDEDGKAFSVDERCDGDYFDPAWTEIDRILDVVLPDGYNEVDGGETDPTPGDLGIVLDRDDDGYEEGLGRQLLIKWENSKYNEVSFEFERDLILNDIVYKQKVKECYERHAQTPESTQKELQEAGEKELRRLYRDVFGEKSETRVEGGVVRFQKDLEAEEYLNGGRLRDYQAEGVSWLLSNFLNNRCSILADEMGLGKTIQITGFLKQLACKLHRRGPFLIVVPLSTIGNWKKELDGWLGLNTVVYHGSDNDRALIRELEMAYKSDRPEAVRRKEMYLKKCAKAHSGLPGNPWMAEIVLTTPELLCTDDFSELTAVKWEILVVDEAHRLKNHCSKFALNLRDHRFVFRHKVLLTGTPIQNTMEELFALLNFVAPDLFDKMDEFIEKYGSMQSKETLDELHEEIRPYILRRLKEDVERSVPPKEETVIEVELSIAQKQYYRALYEKNAKFLNKNKKKAIDGPSLNNLAMQLRKCCNHLFLLNGIEEEFCNQERKKGPSTEEELLVKASGKLVLLDKLLPRLKQNGHRVLIFSQFKIMLDVLEDFLNCKKWKHERIDGSITGLRRQQAIDRFQEPNVEEKDQPFIMLLSTRAGGVGINLTAADTVIIFDSDWNPQNDLQAQARCHRIGQTKSVKVYRLLCRKSYEEKMFKLASQKLGLDQAVLSGFESASSSSTLSKDEIERLLRHGAYEILSEDQAGAEAASNAFIAQDIETIMERNARVIVHENTGSGSSAAGGKFSKARFSAALTPTRGKAKGTAQDVDVQDPDFWKKMLGDAADEDDDEVVVGKRARTAADYTFANYNKELDAQLRDSDVEADGEDGDDDDDEAEEGADGEDDDSFEQGSESESEDEDINAVIMEGSQKPKAIPSSPNNAPIVEDSVQPSVAPRAMPSVAPRAMPSVAPRAIPSVAPRAIPGLAPSAIPSLYDRVASMSVGELKRELAGYGISTDRLVEKGQLVQTVMMVLASGTAVPLFIPSTVPNS